MEGLIKNKKIIIGSMFIIFFIGIIGVIFFVNKKGKDDLNGEAFSADQFVVGNNSMQENSSNNIVSDNVLCDGDGKAEENSKNEIVVHIAGEVNNQGIVKLKKGQRVVDAVEKAGGVTDKADLSRVNLAFILSDGQKVIIPNVNDKQIENCIIDGSGDEIGGGDFSSTLSKISNGGVKNRQKININTASQTELEMLSGIGPSLADKIIKYRNQNGKFKSVEELKNVSGIGEVKFEGIKDEVCVR